MNMRISFVFSLILVLAVNTKCFSAEQEKIEKILTFISMQMKDPESVKVRNLRFFQGKTAYLMCGEINAKNSHGGYSGFEPFMCMNCLEPEGTVGRWPFELPMSMDLCSKNPKPQPVEIPEKYLIK